MHSAQMHSALRCQSPSHKPRDPLWVKGWEFLSLTRSFCRLVVTGLREKLEGTRVRFDDGAHWCLNTDPNTDGNDWCMLVTCDLCQLELPVSSGVHCQYDQWNARSRGNTKRPKCVDGSVMKITDIRCFVIANRLLALCRFP